MSSVSEYGRQIKHGLVDKGMSITELSELVKERTGMFCDQPMISRIIHGYIKPAGRPTIVAAINEILGIEQ